MSTATAAELDVVYPESDGKPMADNTVQWDWMVKIVGELRDQYAGQEVFVAGDLLWYPVEGEPRINAAPDAMVVFGRPAGHRGSYIQWREAGLAPQVVFEVLSPSNTDDELDDKLAFYERYGVEEYYFIDPYDHLVRGYVRRGRGLRPVRKMLGFTSPRLGIRFEKPEAELLILSADGRPFQTRQERFAELRGEIERSAELLAEERKRGAQDRKRALAEAKRADGEAKRAEAEARQKEKLAAKLRELGIDPETL